MTRTDDLRQGGARDRTSKGGGSPFVKWSDRTGEWVEGTVVNLWESKFGKSATLEVTARSDGLAAKGKTEEGEEYTEPVKVNSEVNVGLNYAALKESIIEEDRGKAFHIAFEGWGESKNGDKFRQFAVLEIPSTAKAREPGAVDGNSRPEPDEPDAAPVHTEAGPGHPDADLPFAPLRLLQPWL